MDGNTRTEQPQNDQFVNCSEACKILGLNVLNPSQAMWYYRRTAGFPRGMKLGKCLKWKVSEVLAWRENQHAMSK